MENKNILLIIISICFFFAIIIGAGLLFIPNSSQNNNSSVNVNSPYGNEGYDPSNEYEYVQRNNNETQTTIENNGTNGENNTMSDQNGSGSGTTENENYDAIELTYGDRQEDDIIDLDIRDNSGNTIRNDNTQPQNTDRTQNNNQNTQITQQETTTQETTSNTQTQNTQERQTVLINEYWIQVASLTNLNYAQNINTKLSDLGYTSKILTKDINGSTRFRVRIGPYSNEDEANKFCLWIKTIDDLQDSYVTEVSRWQEIN